MEYKNMSITTVESFCCSNAIDDAKRSEGLVTPESIERFDNILYGVDKTTNYLDVYRPKSHNDKLPVIVSIHGGGWVYGNKDIMQFYCMSLAEKGFSVVNFSYRLAPRYKHPTPFVDTNTVFNWIIENANILDIDAEYHYYGDKEHELKHVFHIDIKLQEARQCNEDECSFFLNHIKE